jgi:hypothetical protein
MQEKAPAVYLIGMIATQYTRMVEEELGTDKRGEEEPV